MADDIVLKVSVDGADEAAADIKKIGESADTTFEDTKKAAETAGLSIEEFGKLSEKTQQAYMELSRRVVQDSQAIVDSTKEVQDAAASSVSGTRDMGGGLDEVSKKSGITTREMRGLSKIMKEFGAGELAGQAFGLYKIATSLGAIGVAAIAVAKVTAEVVKFIKEAVDASKAIDELSKAGGGGVESLARLERAFASAGGKAADFAKTWLEVMSGIEKEDAARNATPDMLKLANSVAYVAYQLQRMALGSKEVISPLTSVKTLSEAIGKVLNDFSKGVVSPFVRIVPPDAANKLEDYMKKLAEMREQFIATGGKAADFDKALKLRGFDDATIANIKLGTKALAELMDRLDKAPHLTKDTTDLLVANVSATAEAIGQIANGFTEGVFRLMRAIPSAVGLLPESVLRPLEALGQSVRDAFTKIKDFIVELFTTPVADPWQWIKDAAANIVTWISDAVGKGKQLITDWVTTPVANAWQWIVDSFNAVLSGIAEKWAAFKSALGFGGGESTSPAGGGGSGFAGGGLLGGRGTGTSDSNLAWVSRGEHLMPASAVRQPGVLAFLEALRLSGGNLRRVLNNMGHFALGGLVLPTLPAGGGMSNVTIQFPGLPEITGLRASSSVVDALRHAAAMAAIRSGGRKPSRYS